MSIKLPTPDRIGALIAILLGCLSFFEAIRLYPFGHDILTGDHTFPGLIGMLLILSGLILLFSRSNSKNEVSLPTGRTAFLMTASLTSLFIYSQLIMYLGYFFSTILAFVFLIKLIGNYRWLFTLLAAAVLTTALYLLFIVLLKTPFPSLLF